MPQTSYSSTGDLSNFQLIMKMCYKLGVQLYGRGVWLKGAAKKPDKVKICLHNILSRRHQNLSIVVPTPHNTLVIMGLETKLEPRYRENEMAQ